MCIRGPNCYEVHAARDGTDEAPEHGGGGDTAAAPRAADHLRCRSWQVFPFPTAYPEDIRRPYVPVGRT
ncbi:hypothetical protein GCM10010388_21840 [Streptomyces mauvecolor]